MFTSGVILAVRPARAKAPCGRHTASFCGPINDQHRSHQRCYHVAGRTAVAGVDLGIPVEGGRRSVVVVAVGCILGSGEGRRIAVVRRAGVAWEPRSRAVLCLARHTAGAVEVLREGGNFAAALVVERRRMQHFHMSRPGRAGGHRTAYHESGAGRRMEPGLFVVGRPGLFVVGRLDSEWIGRAGYCRCYCQHVAALVQEIDMHCRSRVTGMSREALGPSTRCFVQR